MSTDKKVITVNKTVSVKVLPNSVSIELRTECEGKTPKDAAQKENAIAAKLRDAIDSACKTVAMSFADVRYSRIMKDGKTVGYRARRSYFIDCEYDCKGGHSDEFGVIDAAVFAKLIDAVSELGITVNTEFGFEDDGTRNSLIQQAVKQARADAELIAVAAGVGIKSLITAEYSSSGGGRPMLMRAAVGNSFGDGMSDPQEITLTETVTCSWEIE